MTKPFRRFIPDEPEVVSDALDDSYIDFVCYRVTNPTRGDIRQDAKAHPASTNRARQWLSRLIRNKSPGE